MLQGMRNKLKGIVAIFIVVLLTVPLALVGVEQLFYDNTRVNEVAEVNGRTITEREVYLGLSRERLRLQSQFGNSLPADFLTDERLRAPVLEQLIQRALMAAAAKDGNMTLSDAEIDRNIVESADFQVEGEFDPDRFIQIVRSLGHSPASFRDMMRDDLVVNQLQRSVISTGFITDAEIERAVALSRQTRDFEWVTLPLGDSAEAMTVTDEEIASHYEDNKASYLTEEQVAVEYIELKSSDLEKDIDVTEDEVREEFDRELQSLVQTTQREAAHIMIEGDHDEAKQKIATVQEKLAAGEDFAALAKEYSDDFGSKDNGGNLGIVTVGSGTFPTAFEDALQALEEGQVSDPIEADNATHIIKLVSLKQDAPPEFEQEKTRIENALKSQKAQEQFVADVETLNELSYNAETLQEVADELSLPLGKTGLFPRSGGTELVAQDNRVLTAAFSERVLQEGYSSEVLELTPDSVVVIKLIEHKPVRTLTLEEKTADITDTLKHNKAKEQIAKQSESIRDALNDGSKLETLSEQQSLSFSSQLEAQRNAADVPAELLEHIFAMEHPEQDNVTIDGMHLENGDYVVISLSKVTNGSVESLTDEEKTSLRTSLTSRLTGDNYRSWQSLLRDQGDVEVYNAQSPAI